MPSRSIAMDGVSSFSGFFNQSFSWSNHYIGDIGLWSGPNPGTFNYNIALTGAAWATRSLFFSGVGTSNVTITDSNDGVNRDLFTIQLGTGASTLTLFDSRVFYIRAGGSGDSTITLGTQDTTSILLFDGDDRVTLGSGNVDTVNMGSGINTVIGGNGFLDHLRFGGGNNTFTQGNGGVGSIRADGDNLITLSSGAETVRLGHGTNGVNLTGGTIDSLYANGNETISLFGDARILQLKMDEGVNILSSDTGNIETIYAYHAQNTILLGLGGAQQIVLSGSAAKQDVSSVGWLGSLQVDAHDQVNVQTTTVAVGIGGAGYIQTSKGDDIILTGGGKVNHIDTFDGNDTVTIGIGGAGTISAGVGNDTVNGNRGFIDLVQTEDGNDLVTLGAAGARFVALGAGDDTIALVAIPASFGLTIEGDEGSDTVNLSRFTQGLTVGLDQGGNFQDFGVSDLGFFLLHDIQNLIGTAKGDSLTGSAESNLLSGGLGTDAMDGLDGDDQLIGGKGNDSLTGGAGFDTFLFVAGDGSDRISDFTLGEDHLSIAGTHRLGDISFAKAGLNVDVSVGTLHILVEDMTVAAMRDAANFVF